MRPDTTESQQLLRDNSLVFLSNSSPTSTELPLDSGSQHSSDSNFDSQRPSPSRKSFQVYDGDLEGYMDSTEFNNSRRKNKRTNSNARNDPELPRPNLLYEKSSNLLVNIIYSISNWMDGPSKPWSPSITPVFPNLQFFPRKLWDRWPPFFFKFFLWLFLGLWIIFFYLLCSHSILAVPTVDDSSINIINCGTTIQVWLGKNERCGLNATDCRAMDPEMKDFVFKCPAGCVEDSYTWSYTSVGDYESIYRPYVIGGGNKNDQNLDTWNNYRADSYVCAAAIHHGYMTNTEGKIGRIVFDGPRGTFKGSKAGGGIESLDFDSWFPQSYSFDDDFPNQHKLAGSHDLRLVIVWTNIILSVLFAYFTVNGLVFYWVMMILGFWTVALGSNPPWTNANYSSAEAISELISNSFRRFLPFMLGAYVIWSCSARGMLVGMDAHLSKAILWVGGFWVAVMENYTFSKLPINRLIITDIKQQPGGFLTLIIIVSIILCIAIGQAVIIWRMGKFKKYLVIYLLMIFGLFFLASIPNQTLRIHHYILGLLLLPGVGFQTTLGLLYQGLLAGFFVSGIARWDFDSIIQTAMQLNRGDALNYGGLPEFEDALIDYVGNNTVGTDAIVRWYDVMHESKIQGEYLKTLWNGYSLIINDIEVYRGNATEYSLKRWIDHAVETMSLESLNKVYVRLAFANLTPSIGTTGDYTKAGILDLVNAEWTAPAADPS